MFATPVDLNHPHNAHDVDEQILEATEEAIDERRPVCWLVRPSTEPQIATLKAAAIAFTLTTLLGMLSWLIGSLV